MRTSDKVVNGFIQISDKVADVFLLCDLSSLA
jgi:hypothetical protein